MKIKVLSRNDEDYLRETKNDICKIYRNYDKKLHPMEVAREYTRALNATKLDRMFAKPFISSLDGHKEGVVHLDRHPNQISIISSGSADGELRIWDMTSGKCLLKFQAHASKLNGLSFSASGGMIATAGVDSNIHIFKVNQVSGFELKLNSSKLVPGALQNLNFSASENTFASGGESISIWSIDHQDPVRTYELQSEIATCIKFNKTETNLLGACSSDKGLSLYDVRQSVKSAKITLNMALNSISWNPIETNKLVGGCEDSNCYMFDIRYLQDPCSKYYDHSNSVLDVDFSPTGQEFVSSSYDRSIRIFPIDKNRSREVYHTRRMQRVFCSIFTADSQFIACGSDEMNIRLWKTNSSKPLAYLRPRQKQSIDYNQKLISRFQYHPEVKKINSHRHLPRHLFNSIDKKKTEHESRKRKDENIRVFRKEEPPKDHVVINREE